MAKRTREEYGMRPNITNILLKGEAKENLWNINRGFRFRISLLKGIVSRVKGRTTGRIHHLMSNLELRYFNLLDWSEKTTDIREQFALDEISDAIGIADSCEIRYPYDNASGFPYIYIYIY